MAHRIDTADASTTKPTRSAVGPKPNGHFTSSATDGTTVTDDFLEMTQEEICGVIEHAGITLDKADDTQLLAAIKALTEAEYVPLDTGTHALTQTTANTYTYNISEFDWVATGAYTVVPENIRSIHLEAYVYGGNGGTAYVYCTLPDGTETEFSTTANDDGDGGNTIPITIPINAGQSTFTIRGLGNAFRFTIHGATQRSF